MKMLISAEHAKEIISGIDLPPTLTPDYVLVDAARDMDLAPRFWLYERGASWQLHGFMLQPIKGTPYFDIQSPYGYGGPVTNDKDAGFLDASWQAWCDFCRQESVVAEFIRFHPVLENWRDYRGLTQRDRETVIIDLSAGDIAATYASRTKGVLNKAKKVGYRPEWVSAPDALAFFPDLYLTAMRKIGADNSYLFPQLYFERLLAMPAAHCAVCRDADDMIVAASIFLFGDKATEYHLSAATLEGRAAGAPTLLIHAAAQRALDQGCEYLYLGGGTSSQEKDPLFFFKCGFSSRHSPFYIGRKIHAPEAYEALKILFPDAYEKFPNRILFYRS